MTREKKELLDSTFHKFMDIGFGQHNLHLLEEIVARDVVGFGTAIDETLFGIAQLEELLTRQKQQSAGLEMKWKVTTLDLHISSDENTAVFTNEVTLEISTDREPINMYLRFSVVLEFEQHKWVVVHWHGSKPELVESEKDTWGLDLWKAKADELEKLVAERTAELLVKNRELEIETALERVRARTMAMQKSEELGEVATVLFSELNSLVDDLWTCGFVFCEENRQEDEWWLSLANGLIQPFFLPNVGDFTHETLYKGWENGEAYRTVTLENEMLQEHYDWLMNIPIARQIFDEMEGSGIPRPNWQRLHAAYFKTGYLVVITEIPCHEEEIFKRFAQVFDLTYTRFLDLQKAEAQAREAQIEAALERIRSRSMGMQRAEDLRGVVKELYVQLKLLGFKMGVAAIQIIDEATGDMDIWMEGFEDGYELPERYHVPYFNHLGQNEHLRRWRSGEQFAVLELSGDEKKSYDHYFFNHTDFAKAPEPTKIFMMNQESLISSMAYMKYGAIGWAPSNIDTEQTLVLQRVAKVFEQTYTRFLDLQKAEAQARESHIQLALERVRARTMAMQKSDELPDAANLLFQQVQSLGMPAWSAGYCTWDDDEKSSVTLWMSSEGVLQPPFSAPTKEDQLFIQMRVGAEEGKELHVVDLGGEELEQHYRYMRELPVVGEILDSIIEAGHPLPTFQIMHQAYFSKGFLLFITYEPVPESHDIFKRFAKVFDQTYTRFLDLQKAEAQAREAQIEAALERVRSRSMAMHKSEELREVIQLVFEQFRLLNFNIDSAQFDPDYKASDDLNLWTAVPGQPYSTYQHIPYFDNPIFNSIKEAKEKKLSFHAQKFSFEKKNEFFMHFFKYITYVPKERQKLILESPGFYRAVVFLENIALAIQNYSNIPYTNEEIAVLKRFGKTFEQVYTRFLDLQKAEAQAREAQIEASLERVRSRAMAMQHSVELSSLISVVYAELTKLDVTFDRCFIMMFDPDTNGATWWMASPEAPELSRGFKLPYHEYGPHLAYLQGWKERKEKWEYVAEGEVKRNWDDYIFSETELSSLPEAAKAYMKSVPRVCLSASFNTFGCLTLGSSEPLTDESFSVLARFARVFEICYTRFNDLKQAEAQAREAQVEAALERVRSRTMAMQRSEELPEVAGLLFQQVKTLGVPQFHCGFNIFEIDDKECTWYPGSADGDILPPCKIPLTEHPIFMNFIESRKRGDELCIYEKEGEYQAGHYRYMLTLPVLGEILQNMLDAGIPFPTFQIDHLANFSHGNLLFITSEHFPEMHDTFKRFAKVFEQTYTRFLDLQKAEAQAREAQIEAALEKVRGRTMAMQSSDELADAAYVLFEQLNFLGVTHERINIGIVNEDNHTIDFWVTEQGGNKLSTRFSGRISEPTTLSKAYDSWKKGEKSLVVDLIGEELKSWLQYLNEEIKIPFNKAYLHSRRVQTVGFFSKGMLVVTSPEPLQEEAMYLLEKFAGVFDLTYTRFSDLKQAEAQAREAQIGVAMERIRARALAMQSSAELSDVAKVMREQMGILGQEDLEASVVHLYSDDAPTFDSWYAFRAGDQILEGTATFRFENSDLAKEFLQLYKDEITEYTIEVKGEKLKEWLREIQRNAPQIAAYWGDLPPEKQFYHFSDFSGGALLMVSHENLTEETQMLQKRCASVFELAYKRFLDLEAKERQERELLEEKLRLEHALSELKATQSQLVQQEKLASLGQLTAGIAHEIKNPLNFVNNFSEVSIEMIGEVIDSRLKTQDTRPKTEADEIEDEILEDIKANLEKIHEHGSRANGIVTSMLQHSRGGSGKKEPTDLNALIKEYVNLSFHGMRAGKNPINVEIALDLDDTIKEIPLVREDFTRVIINLCNNAFDAMRQKFNSELLIVNSELYHPKLTVRTKSEKDRIAISVEDNGPGIPDEIKDKILQPFFTTKKGTEGTGLGLSITHDIVKAHGGELEVESSLGSGAKFIIKLNK